MDGFEVARRIQLDPGLSGDTIMMLTSATRSGDAIRCQELGVRAYLVKPVRRSELREAILSAVEEPAQAPPASAAVERPARQAGAPLPLPAAAWNGASGARILLTEDNPVNRMVATRLLTKLGHQVTLAGNGREALLAWSKDPVNGFDLILMDIQMPEMDGLEATAAIRARERETQSHIPIVAMTAHAMKGDHQRCLAGGMDAYISKPIHTKELTKMIEQLTGFAAPRKEPAVPAAAPPQKPDMQAMLGAFDGDMELLREVAGLFLQDAPEQLAVLREALEKKDAALLCRTAHSLKGSASNFAFPPAVQALQKLEAAGKQGSLAEAQKAFAAAEQQVALLRAALAAFQKLAVG